MSPTVVIADDDGDIRALVAISAVKAGLRIVSEVEDGDAAWESIKNLVPDLAVLDISMPGLTGLEVCRLVRADPSLDGIRVLLLSAAASGSSIEAGLDAGATEYLSKPFSPRELTARLAAHREAVQ